MSSRLLISRSMRSASSIDRVEHFGRALQRACVPVSMSVLAAPVMAASGVRSSCETPESSVLRRNSASTRSHACGLPPRAPPLDRDGATWMANASRSLPCSARRRAWTRRRRKDAEDTDGAARPDQRHVLAAAAGSVAVSAPGGLDRARGPLRHAQLLVVDVAPACPRRSTSLLRRRAASEDDEMLPNTSALVRTVAATISSGSRAGELATQRKGRLVRRSRWRAASTFAARGPLAC